MIPVRTRASNFVYRGPTPDVGDAWVERRPAERAVMLTWRPSEEERAAIAGGALIELGIYNVEPIPPVSVNVSDRTEISAIGATLRDRATSALMKAFPGGLIPAGFWTVSPDVWEDLNASEALDPNDGSVPKLIGRPLMQVDEGQGVLEYAQATVPA